MCHWWIGLLRFCLLVLAVVYCLPATTYSQQDVSLYVAKIEGGQTPNRKGLDPFTLAQLMAKYGVPGLSIAVINEFQIHWSKGYGIADIKTGAAVDKETLFQAASISKAVAAMAILKAVEKGLFSLDGDINRIIESWQLPLGETTEKLIITPRSLLSHTSGLGDGFGFPGYPLGAPLPTVVQILKGEKPSNVGSVHMERPPGTAFKYSGGGVTLMQLALEDSTDEPFPDILQEWVLRPIGMLNSNFEQPLGAGKDNNAARAHGMKGQAKGDKWHVYPELQAAGLWTTSTDLAKFLVEVQKSLRGDPKRVLTRSLAKEMVSPVGVGDYGVGFRISKLGEGWYFGHGGSNWGFRCKVLAHQTKGYGIVIMTNSDNGSVVINELQNRVASAYGWDMLDKAVPR